MKTQDAYPPLTEGTIAGQPITVIRWDLNHALISGNKAEKLHWHQHLIDQRPEREKPCIVSMGGPWSNHLHALSAACYEAGLSSCALIRGYPPKVKSPTLKDLEAWGTVKHYVSHSQYRALRTKSTDYFSKLERVKPTDNPHDAKRLSIIKSLPNLGALLNELSASGASTLCHTLNRTFLQCEHFGKHLTELLPDLSLPTPNWWIPEGGNNALGIWSIAAWAKKTLEHYAMHFSTGDTWVIPVGSGATFKGILAGFTYAALPVRPRLIGVPVFKNSQYLEGEITQFTATWLNSNTAERLPQWLLWHNPHLGGFGKLPTALANNALPLAEELGVPLDRVYTLKVAYALSQYFKPQAHTSQNHNLDFLLEKGGALPEKTSPGTTSPGGTSLGKVFLLHTGGLQGNRPLSTGATH